MRRLQQLRNGNDKGMATAEYAMGTAAACGFSGVLFEVLTDHSMVQLISDLVRKAITSFLPF